MQNKQKQSLRIKLNETKARNQSLERQLQEKRELVKSLKDAKGIKNDTITNWWQKIMQSDKKAQYYQMSKTSDPPKPITYTPFINYLKSQLSLAKQNHSQFLCQSTVISPQNLTQRHFIKYQIQKLTQRKVLGSRTIYRHCKDIAVDAYKFINEIQNILLLVRLPNGYKVGAFSECGFVKPIIQCYTKTSPSSTRTNLLHSMLISVTGMTTYPLHPLPDAQPIGSFVDALQWGNKELLVGMWGFCDNVFGTEFGDRTKECYDSKGHTFQDFVGVDPIEHTFRYQEVFKEGYWWELVEVQLEGKKMSNRNGLYVKQTNKPKQRRRFC